MEQWISVPVFHGVFDDLESEPDEEAEHALNYMRAFAPYDSLIGKTGSIIDRIDAAVCAEHENDAIVQPLSECLQTGTLHFHVPRFCVLNNDQSAIVASSDDFEAARAAARLLDGWVSVTAYGL